MSQLQNMIITKIILITEEDISKNQIDIDIGKVKLTMNKIDNINEMDVYQITCNYLITSSTIIIHTDELEWYAFNDQTIGYNFVHDLHKYLCPVAEGETICSIYNRFPKFAMNLYSLKIGG